jgi:hypothetical protein
MKYVKNVAIGGGRHGGAVHYSWVAAHVCASTILNDLAWLLVLNPRSINQNITVESS